MMSRFTTYIAVFAILFPSILNGDPCQFTDSIKGTIDLAPLSEKGGKAKYPDKIPAGGGSNWKYSFNPCKPFSEGSTCVAAAVCQVSLDGLQQFILGKQDSATWDAGAGTGTNPILKYTYPDPSGQKNVEIELMCNDDAVGNLNALGEFGIGLYKFQLSSKCSCWNGCQGGAPGGGAGGGLSFGEIFLIILGALAFVYFVVFLLYNRFRLQQSGLDLIPHRTFWVAVPVYAKDGVTYVFRLVTRRGGEYRSV